LIDFCFVSKKVQSDQPLDPMSCFSCVEMPRAIVNGQLAENFVEVTTSNAHIVAIDACEIVVSDGGHFWTTTLLPGQVFTSNVGGSFTVQIATSNCINCSETRHIQNSVEELCRTDRKPQLSQLATGSRTHGHVLLENAGSVNIFESGGVTCCVVRKAAKPRYHRRCPKIMSRAAVRATLSRAAAGETPWKQCGATFSTMMRHFQKASDVFSWQTDPEKQTTIRAHA
jgi:hypothetical protein